MSVSAVRLVDGCYLVGSGWLGFELTSPWDSHVYLVRSGSDALLVDTGCGRAVREVTERIDAVLGRDGVLVGIVLTHGHVDHSGGAAALSSRYDVPVYASPAGVPALRDGDEDSVGLPAARAAGVYPPDQVLSPVPRATALPAGGLDVGGLRVEAVPTAGHARDHVVYVVDLPSGRAVFSGDLVFARGRIAVLGTPDTDLMAYASSVRAVAARTPHLLFPGHGEVVLSNATRHVEAAVEAFDRAAVPPGFLP